MSSSIYQSLQETYLQDVYNEGYKNLPHDKMIKKSDQYDKQYKFGPGKTDAEYKSREAARGKSAGTFLATVSHDPKRVQQKSADNKNRPESEKRSKTISSKPNNFGNRLMRKDGQGIRDSYDYSDAILSYLLDEGYVDNEESGMIFLNHMSDEWMNSILATI